MPVPIMLETTSAVALNTPSCRRRAAFRQSLCIFYELRGCCTSYAPWHFLYFLPLPQGQGSLRPTLRGSGAGRRPALASLRVVFIGRSASNTGFEPMQPQALVEREHHQLRLAADRCAMVSILRSMPLIAAARGLAGHGQA